MSKNKISITISNIGYQKPTDIIIRGVDNIYSAEITPVTNANIVVGDSNNVSNSKPVFNEPGVNYISNVKDNCIYEFVEDIEVSLKGRSEIIEYAYVEYDGEYEVYDYTRNKEYKKRNGTVVKYYRVLYEVYENNYEGDEYEKAEARYEKKENGEIAYYYRIKKNGVFENAEEAVNFKDYENEDGRVVLYGKIIEGWKYHEQNKNVSNYDKNIYEFVSETDVTSIGHVIIKKLKLESTPTIYYKVIRYVEITPDGIYDGKYETNSSNKKVEYAYNTRRKLYEVYKQQNESFYRKKKDGNDEVVIKYYKEIRGNNTYIDNDNFNNDNGWRLERDENNKLIKYAINLKNNAYEKYNPDNQYKYSQGGGERVGIPFILSISYVNMHGKDEKKSVYFAITIPYKTMGSNLEIPLLYRPFYFNSVLLLTPKTLTEKYDYDIRSLHTQTKNKSLSSEECYGRLFYSIANGCSIREDIGNANLYKLNDITLSCINGNDAFSMVIEKPFRTFSEIRGTTKGRAALLKETDKSTREMMYGITEPFLYKIFEVGERTTDISTIFITQNGDNNYFYSAIDKNMYADPNNWEVRTMGPWTHYLSIDGTTPQPIKLKIERTCEGYWDPVYKRYHHNFWFYQVGNDKVIGHCYFSRRKSGWQRYYAYTKISKNGDGTYNLEPGAASDVNKITWQIDVSFREPERGSSYATVYGYYTKEETLYYKIAREGYPCVFSNGNEGTNPIKIKYKDIKNNENSEAIDDGIREIYCNITSENSFEEGTGSIIPVYSIEKKTNEDNLLKPIIFDTSKWLDVSFSVTEGHPEDDEDADTAFSGLNDIKFYDDITYGTIGKQQYEGVHVKGYSSSNVRYFALKGDYENINQEAELRTILNSLYGIGATEVSNYVRYNGVNINDNIYINSSKKPCTKNSGWKGIHTYFKHTGDSDVWLSGKFNGSSNHTCIDITGVLNDLRKNPYQSVGLTYRCGVERKWVIGVCDNYTCLDTDAYDKENENPYFVIKPHTSRFAVIRLYKVKD
jgi:hypothetical protein